MPWGRRRREPLLAPRAQQRGTRTSVGRSQTCLRCTHRRPDNSARAERHEAASGRSLEHMASAAETRDISVLSDALDEFVRHRSPQLLACEVAGLLAVRLVWSSWSWVDVVVI